jgi:hypothetical protein
MTMDIPAIATELAAAIMAASPAALPSHELMLQKFTDAHDRLGQPLSEGDHTKLSQRSFPSESDHQRVCSLVRAMIDKR